MINKKNKSSRIDDETSLLVLDFDSGEILEILVYVLVAV